MSTMTTLESKSLAVSVPALSKEEVDAEGAMAKPSRPTFWQHLNTEVDPAQSTGPLAAFCFMTGFMCVQETLVMVRRC